MSLHSGCRNRFILGPFRSNAPIILVLLFWFVWIAEYTRPNSRHTSALFFLSILYLLYRFNSVHISAVLLYRQQTYKITSYMFRHCVCDIIRQSAWWLQHCFRNGPLHQHWSLCSQRRTINRHGMLNKALDMWPWDVASNDPASYRCSSLILDPYNTVAQEHKIPTPLIR